MSLYSLPAAEAARQIANGDLTSRALVQACLDRIAARDDQVGAWIWLDADLALRQADDADAALAAGHGVGPLHGVPVGIKDIIATRDMPTQDGYAGHEGRHTHADAYAVGQLRDAGAIILGKTVTTELASRTPGKTKNPIDPAYTPGGSSSGSAAAVRDRQVPLALGTQTGGSVIRPASFCGIHALKPTFGLIARRGVTLQADWLDTIGTYGNSIEDVALLTEQMLVRDLDDPQAIPRSRPPLRQIAMAPPPGAPRFAFMRTHVWDQATEQAQKAIEGFAESLGSACVEVEMPEWMAEAWRWQRVLQTYGNAIHYGPLAERDGPLMSQSMHDQIAEGHGITENEYRHAVAKRSEVNAALNEIFASYDAILTLPATGIAPTGQDFTGDPVFNAFWTYAGVPCVNLPLLDVGGMLLGVQLVGPRLGDGALLRTARALEDRVLGS